MQPIRSYRSLPQHDFLDILCVPSLVLGIKTLHIHLLLYAEKGSREKAHISRFFGNPLHAISRSSHQDAQTPPSPLVGEGGRGG
jgi:hypothetical protein